MFSLLSWIIFQHLTQQQVTQQIYNTIPAASMNLPVLNSKRCDRNELIFTEEAAQYSATKSTLGGVRCKPNTAGSTQRHHPAEVIGY
jgi:hypothetical protein